LHKYFFIHGDDSKDNDLDTIIGTIKDAKHNYSEIWALENEIRETIGKMRICFEISAQTISLVGYQDEQLNRKTSFVVERNAIDAIETVKMCYPSLCVD
jgi:hypothetical protein